MFEVYSARLGKTIQVRDICDDKRATTMLVSEIKKEGDKPVKNLTIANLDKEQAKIQAVAEMSCEELSPLTAVTCLYQIGLKTSGELDSPWVTYGRTLTTPAQGTSEAAAALANIACPMTLIDLKTTVSTMDYDTTSQSTETDLTTGPPVSVEEDWKILLAVAAYYRICSVDSAKSAYRNTLLSSANGLLCLKPGQNWLERAGTTYDLSSNQDVQMLLALWDMFFQKFPKHQLSKARWGTQITRYKDSGLLETMKRTANCFGWSWRDLAPWACNDYMAREFKALLDTDDEIDDDYGYLPYQSSLALVKSSYSATANPNIHLFCRMFFATRKDNYGYNAVALDASLTRDIIFRAFLLVLAHGSYKKTPIMSATSDSHEAKKELPGISKELPTTQNAKDWILWFQMLKGRFPDTIRQEFLKIIADAQKRGSRNRKGSVGEKLAQFCYG